MNALLLAALVVGGQADEDRAAPLLPEAFLPSDGAEGVPLDTLVWTTEENASVIGPDGAMEVEVAATLDGPRRPRGVRPVAGFAPEARYSIVVGGVTLGEFETGTEDTSTAPTLPTITNGGQVIDDGGNRTLRFGVEAFEGLFVLVNRIDRTDARFDDLVTTGGLYERAFVARDGPLDTTFTAMNSAGQLSESVTVAHAPPPAGCTQTAPSTTGVLAILLVLTSTQRRRARHRQR